MLKRHLKLIHIIRRPGLLTLAITLTLVLAFTAPAAPTTSSSPALPGIEVLVRQADKPPYAEALRGLRVGILTNPTGVDRQGRSTIDLVRALPGVNVARLFAPEHGLRGGFQAGESVADARDPVSGLPIVSLHGTARRPPAETLRGLDAIFYDIQDVGHRTYTFVSTLTYLMEACEKAGVAVWVLDRPDPLGGGKVGGPLLQPDLYSFIGAHAVPQVYGLTPGEWARLVQKERFPRLKLTVVPMAGWRRGMTYGDLGWLWVPPSEHIPRWETAFFYAMTGTLGELQLVSEGVGTPLPFEQVGAPWIDGTALAAALEAERLPEVTFRPTTFRPRYGTHAGQFCQGAQIHLLDPRACDPAKVSLALLRTLTRLYPDRRLFAPTETESYEMFVKALGSGEMAKILASGGPLDTLDTVAHDGIENYVKRHRAAALIYQD